MFPPAYARQGPQSREPSPKGRTPLRTRGVPDVSCLRSLHRLVKIESVRCRGRVSSPAAMLPRMPVFPLSEPPLCKNRNCQQVQRRCVRALTSKGRYCYGCANQHPSIFCTYDDDEGVSDENPACRECNYHCRKERTNSGIWFYKCAVGRCLGPERGTTVPPHALVTTPTKQASSLGTSETQSAAEDIDWEFERLLKHAKTTAERAPFPRKDGMVQAATNWRASMSGGDGAGDSALTPPTPFIIRSSKAYERHEKVGAAGEYFVGSPSFALAPLLCVITAKSTVLISVIQVVMFLRRFLGEQLDGVHWRSRLRNAVKQHLGHEASGWPEFTDAEDYADIVFPDEHGTLTRLLIEMGHLDPQQWTGRQPWYLIEVKSTLGSRSTNFYLSAKQFYTVCFLTHPTHAGRVSTLTECLF